jgi:hypothetical protein
LGVVLFGKAVSDLPEQRRAEKKLANMATISAFEEFFSFLS